MRLLYTGCSELLLGQRKTSENKPNPPPPKKRVNKIKKEEIKNRKRKNMGKNGVSGTPKKRGKKKNVKGKKNATRHLVITTRIEVPVQSQTRKPVQSRLNFHFHPS
jgi:hypothetical protein